MFDYVDADAVKGGRIVLQSPTRAYNQNFNTFDTLNIYVLRGSGAMGMPLTFATLMGSSSDEIGSAYAYAAQSLTFAENRKVMRFIMNPAAQFHDGSSITAADVVFSLETLREKGHENLASVLRNIESINIEDEDTIVVRLSSEAGRSVALTIATLCPIFSAAWWKDRDFGATLSEAPLGSGPYRVGRFRFGSFIEFERVDGIWSKDLPVMVGRYNFDVIRYDYYRDRVAAFEGFKSGSTTFREEFTSKTWALDYNFPAFTAGRVKRQSVPDESPSGGQAWFFNTRRAKFKDPRVRQAIGLLFDFEWTNKNLMYSSFDRSASFYEKTEMKATGLPKSAELALLEPFKGGLPESVFGEAYSPPASDGSGRDRKLAREALNLFQAAGCKLDNGRMMMPDGTQLEFEFLDDDNSFEPHHNAFINNLRRLGINATYRVVDASQYTDRTREYDFDITISRYTMPLYPDDFILQIFGSRSASRPGSYNLAGIADPAVDAMLRHIIASDTQDAFVAANRALDRILRARHYFIFQWNKGERWLAYWDIFSRPAIKPRYDTGVLDTWSYSAEKAAKSGNSG